MTSTAEQQALPIAQEAMAQALGAVAVMLDNLSYNDIVRCRSQVGEAAATLRGVVNALASEGAGGEWFAWPARKAWEEVRVELRSRDGNIWQENAADFQYWINSVAGDMCDDVVGFRIVGEMSLQKPCLIPDEPVPAIPDGYKLVPIVPAREMWAAGADAVVGYKQRHHDKVVADLWGAMLAAVPAPKTVSE